MSELKISQKIKFKEYKYIYSKFYRIYFNLINKKIKSINWIKV